MTTTRSSWLWNRFKHVFNNHIDKVNKPAKSKFASNDPEEVKDIIKETVKKENFVGPYESQWYIFKMRDNDMLITALLEAWTIKDGNYPDLAIGIPVNLSFEMSALALHASGDLDDCKHLGAARYHFSGFVMQRYDDPDVLVVVSANWLRFFSEGTSITHFSPGDRIAGDGLLVVDYYIWTENLPERPDAIDISYNLIVERIRPLITILPNKHDDPLPTNARLSDMMIGEDLDRTAAVDNPAAMYLIDFRVVDRPIAPTFL